MPFNGSGTYAAPASTWNPAVTNTAINSTDWIALLADLTTALSTCLLKDGQQTPTANIPMGGFKFTGLAAGNATGNSLRYEQLFPTLNTIGPINETKTTVASATTPDIWTSVGNVVDYTGTVTATGFAAAPQAGARRTLICAGAAPFTAGANMLIDGVASGSTYTAVAGDRINVVAVTTTQFRLTTPHTPYIDTYPVVQGSADATKQLRFEVDGLTTATTRVLTPPDADLTLPAVTAKGDVPAATASGVLSKIAVGTDGNVLMADSSQATGVNYGSRGGIFPFSTGGTGIADGLTVFAQSSFAGASESNAQTPLPFACTVKNLYCVASGAAAGTRTYTLRKNGADTALTCASSGATGSANDTTHSVTFAAGDTIDLKLVTSGGATTATHQATVELVKTGT